MKIIISENQLGLIRRTSEIERLIDPTMDMVYEYLQGSDPSPLEKRLYGMKFEYINSYYCNMCFIVLQ